MADDRVVNAADINVAGKLVGEDCQYCDGGILESGQYKGDHAILCADCGTPAFRTVG